MTEPLHHGGARGQGGGSSPGPQLETLVVFSHGKESGPWGTKIQQMAFVVEQASMKWLSVDCRSCALSDAEARVRRLRDTLLPAHQRLILVGSSMGAYVSVTASASLHPAGLFLLAPAFGLPGYAEPWPVPHAQRTAVVHGWGDEVVPLHHSVRWAGEHRAALHLLDGDHRLDAALPEILPLFERFLCSS